MFKFKFDTSDFDASEIVDGFRSRFKSAVAALVSDVNSEADKVASLKLKVGLKKWKEGFKINKVTDDFYIISVTGQLANWMEQGMQAGEVSKAIMQGNRAEHNKSEGKNYVDVPIARDADAAGNMTLGKKGPKVNVSAFKNADDLIKNVTFSDWKRGGVRQEKRIISRVQDIIKSTKPETGETNYLTIRRVTDKSQWPKTPFQGAKVLESLDTYIENNFDKILERMM